MVVRIVYLCVLSFSISFCSNGQENLSKEVIDCLFEGDIQAKELFNTLDNFEKELVKKNLVEESKFRSYKSFLEKLSDSIQFTEIRERIKSFYFGVKYEIPSAQILFAFAKCEKKLNTNDSDLDNRGIGLFMYIVSEYTQGVYNEKGEYIGAMAKNSRALDVIESINEDEFKIPLYHYEYLFYLYCVLQRPYW
ncbi:MAG: hypothetical protein OEW75_11425 [Cyclobacteriaceae bacterium]|nr:hypothetical protein [Cyclobacteriaceae bacterium]